MTPATPLVSPAGAPVGRRAAWWGHAPSTARAPALLLALLLAAGTLATLPVAAAEPAPAPITLQDDRGQRITLPRPAQRVVSLLPSLTEGVCALGGCNRLVGIDRFSNWPASVQALPRLGGLEDTTLERLLALKPDLVLAAGSARVLPRLAALGIPVLALEPRNLADTRRMLGVLAQALGRPAEAEALWARIEQQLAAAADRVPPALHGRTVYFEVGSAPFAAGAASFVGELLARLHLANVVPAAMGPFPQLNPEFVVRAQPGLVMAPVRALAEMPARPGWSALVALRQRQVCGFDEAGYDSLVRPGPRLADGAALIADCLAALPAAGGSR